MGARDHQALRPAPLLLCSRNAGSLSGRSHGSAGVGASLATTSVTPVKPPPSSPRHDPPDGAQARIKPLIQDSKLPGRALAGPCRLFANGAAAPGPWWVASEARAQSAITWNDSPPSRRRLRARGRAGRPRSRNVWLWKPLHGTLPPGGAVGRLDRRRIAPVAGSPRDARTRTLAGLQCRDVVVLARLSRPGRGSSEHCDVEARGGLRDRADSEVCRGSVAAEKAVPDPGAGWERRWRALLMRSPSVPSRIRPTKRPSDTLRM